MYLKFNFLSLDAIMKCKKKRKKMGMERVNFMGVSRNCINFHASGVSGKRIQVILRRIINCRCESKKVSQIKFGPH